MAKKTVLVDIGDLLTHATTKGYDWNQFIEILTKDRFLPWCDTPLRALYEGMGDEYGYSKETSDVLDSFCISLNAKNITINLSS